MAICVTPASKARQGLVVLAACQLYVSIFMHLSTTAVPRSLLKCAAAQSEAQILGNAIHNEHSPAEIY